VAKRRPISGLLRKNVDREIGYSIGGVTLSEK
jgi:hypothetical protein